MKYRLIGAAMLALPAVAFAGSTGNVGITKISSGSTGIVYIYTDETTPTNPAGCSKNYAYVVPDTSPVRKEFMAVLLTAAAGGSQVNLAINNSACYTVGSNTFPQVYNVQLVP